MVYLRNRIAKRPFLLEEDECGEKDRGKIRAITWVTDCVGPVGYCQHFDFFL